jgi:hypothetical protein
MVKPSSSGQIHTVEAITAAIILISIIGIVVEATSVTPLTSSFTNQHVKLELQNIGTDILTALDETPISGPTEIGSSYSPSPSQLKSSIITWLGYGGNWFTCTDTINYKGVMDTTQTLSTPLTDTLSLVLLRKSGIAFNVDLRYSDGNGNIKTSKMVSNGDPSSNSVTVSRIVVLHNGDVPSTSVIPDISQDTDLWNVVEVRLSMWVM